LRVGMSKCDFDMIWAKAVELGIVCEEARRKDEESRGFREGYVTGLLLRAVATGSTEEGKKEDLPGE
jgi:hypothetical protein